LTEKPKSLKAIDRVVSLDPQHPRSGVMAEAANLVHQGQVVVFPTHGLYGLGADALNVRAVERVFALKGRDLNKPVLVLIDDIAMLDQVALALNDRIRYLMRQFWPGKVTFVVPALRDLPHGLTGGSGKIGVRQVAHPVARALVGSLGRPLTGTSANPAGGAGCSAISQLQDSIREKVALILDAGTLAGGPGSTVVDVTGETPIVLRRGAVAEDALMAAFETYLAAPP